MSEFLAPEASDLAAMTEQLGRPVRGVVTVAARFLDNTPIVATTLPRLDDGTPFPTVYYLTEKSLTAAASQLEAEGVMALMQERLAESATLTQQYEAAHESYLADRAQFGDVAEISGISAGGMPNRVKCLHAVIAHSLAKGPGVNPMGDWAIALLPEKIQQRLIHRYQIPEEAVAS